MATPTSDKPHQQAGLHSGSLHKVLLLKVAVTVQDDILMVGGSGGRESRPQYVQNEWSVASEFLRDFSGTVGT